MMRAFASLLVGGLLCSGCGGEARDLGAELAALPGVTVEQTETNLPFYTYYVLQFTQPVDHDAPGGQTFSQRVSLVHHDLDVPMVALTSGYHDYYRDRTAELTNLVFGNQISIEHRYFADSRPEPTDWTKLTIEQMAADEHHIIEALRTIYDVPFLTTGGSKGGMTATYHRRFYPDDVDGTVPYVAPLSFGAPDPRYLTFLDTVGPAACRQAVREAAIAMIQRRTEMENRARAQSGHIYTRISLEAAVESSIASLDFAFWQYSGVTACPNVPLPTAADDDLFNFLDATAPIGDSDDAQVALFEPYYYQAYQQLGYPESAAYLEPYLMFEDADYDGALPTPPPTYDGGAAMRDIAEFVTTQGSRFLFVYGQWDPWTAGQYELGGATDSLLVIEPEGTHGARINGLAAPDRDAAYDKIEAWTGVRPRAPGAALANIGEPVREPHVPPAMIRALRARR
ncbi:MAG: S28 family serine protease [Kofleriaceae bacterium]